MKFDETIRKEAAEELKQSFIEDGLSINPGDLEERKPSSIRISSTMEEFAAYLFENPFLRPNFKLDSEILQIPVFFNKLNNNAQDFIADIREYFRYNPDNVIMYTGFHVLNREPISSQVLPENLIDKEGKISFSMASKISEISNLKPYKRQYLLDAISNIIAVKNDVLALKNMTNEEIFASAVFYNQKVISIFNLSSYDRTPPKCVIVDSTKSKLTNSALVRLLLMHYLAFDVLVSSYKSYSSIENYFPLEYFDVHNYNQSKSDYKSVREKKPLLPIFFAVGFASFLIYVVIRWGLKLF